MKRTLFVCLSLIALLSLNACSTVLNSTTETIELKSVPHNANITIDGRAFGTTPQFVNIERGQDHVVRFEFEGYEPYEIHITRKISSSVWLNIFNGFIPGLAIDMFTGSMYYLLPDLVEAELNPAKVVEDTKKKKK